MVPEPFAFNHKDFSNLLDPLVDAFAHDPILARVVAIPANCYDNMGGSFHTSPDVDFAFKMGGVSCERLKEPVREVSSDQIANSSLASSQQFEDNEFNDDNDFVAQSLDSNEDVDELEDHGLEKVLSDAELMNDLRDVRANPITDDIDNETAIMGESVVKNIEILEVVGFGKEPIPKVLESTKKGPGRPKKKVKSVTIKNTRGNSKLSETDTSTSS